MSLPLDRRPCMTGRRLLVVGGGTRPSDDPDAPIGIGRAISVSAGREGAEVAVADIDLAAAQDTVRLVEGNGSKAHALHADVTDAEQCARLVAEAVHALGALDAVVLNVGTGAGLGLAGTTPEMWDAVVSLNLRAHFLIAREVLPHLGEGASVVFVGSVAGLKPGTGIPSYDSTKAALAGLMRHTALELAPRRARANMVVPGLIDTPLGRLARGGGPSLAEGRVPLGRDGSAWEVAQAALFLLSNDSSYVTGQQLVVDGGMTTL